MTDRIGYGTSKAALVMLTQYLALEGAPHGIRANAVFPGFIDTPAMRRSLANEPDSDGTLTYLASLHPVGRMGYHVMWPTLSSISPATRRHG